MKECAWSNEAKSMVEVSCPKLAKEDNLKENLIRYICLRMLSSKALDSLWLRFLVTTYIVLHKTSHDFKLSVANLLSLYVSLYNFLSSLFSKTKTLRNKF